MGDEDIEWIDPVFGGLKNFIWDARTFWAWVDEVGLQEAAELLFRFHRIIANQLIAKGVTERHSSEWAFRTVRLCGRAKALRNALSRLYADEFGIPARAELLDRLKLAYPRIERDGRTL